MEKVVQYKSINYKVIKEGENVVIQKEVNGSFVNIEGQELTDFLNFINGRVVSVDVPVNDKNEELKSQITDDILHGKIKTLDEITERLDGANLTEAEKEALLKELEQVLLDNLATNLTAEELEAYRQSIFDKFKQRRGHNEYLLSEFYMYNGSLMHHMVEIDSGTGEQREISKRQFEMNELVIDKLVIPSLADFAANQEHIQSGYEIKTSIVGDTADYTFVGSKNSSTAVKDISVNLAKRLQKEADQTELLDSAYEKAPEEDEEIEYNNEETQDDNLEYDENGMPLQREEPLKLERKKKEEKYGYMNLPLILVLITIFGIGLYFLTKYILLK